MMAPEKPFSTNDMCTYLVGGAVRDCLLGLPVSERDWLVVGSTPQQMIAAGYVAVGNDFPVFLHPKTKEEYALARTERKTGHGYTGFDCHYAPDVSLEDDLLRRDLTINAIAQDKDGTLYDPYGGRRDLEEKWLRHVSPAFIEDPLRVLRVARFAARFHHLGFRVAPETLALMTTISNSGELEHLPSERVWKEAELAIKTLNPGVFFNVLAECDALPRLFLELAPFTEADVGRLQLANSEHNLYCHQRFALLMLEKPAEAIHQACDRLKAPNACREMALLAQSCIPDLFCTAASPNAQLELLQHADAFRRPDRFRQLLEISNLLNPGRDWASYWFQRLDLCLSVDARALVASGLKGPAVGEALGSQRLALLQTLHA